MKPLASRTLAIKPSPTLGITALAKKMQAEGKNVLSFGAGEPDFDTPEFVRMAAKKAIDSGKTKYTATPGTPELLKAIAAKLKRDNAVSYEPHQILTSNGGKHSLFNAMAVLVEPGDEVIIPAPYWVTYPEQVRLFGGHPVIVPTEDKNNFCMTSDQLRQAISPRTKLVVINSPGNPTGAAYSRAALLELANICVENDLWIVSDEIYEHIIYDGFEHACVASLSPQIKDRTVLVNGASKCYSMTGWRMGFAAGPDAVIKAMATMQEQATSNICSITQAAATEAFAGPQEFLKDWVASFKARRDYIVKALNAIPGISCNNPQGAFYVFPNISKLFGKKTPSGKTLSSSESFCLYLLEEHLVACVHGSAFGAEGYMRLSYATDMKTITEGVERIAAAVRGLV